PTDELSCNVLNREPCIRLRHEIADDLENLRFCGLGSFIEQVFVQLRDIGHNLAPRRRVADDRDERPEDLLEPRLEIARPGAYFRARVPEVAEPIREELVPDLTRLLLEAAVEIERYTAPDRAAAHVLRHAAALKRPVLEEAA